MPRWLPLLLLLGCSSTRSPEKVADRFVDKYYVEFDHSSALALAGGVAKLRLDAELSLVGAARRGTAPGSHAARVYYERTGVSGSGTQRQAGYTLRIKPQGGKEFQRTVQIELAEEPDGTWRVTRFNETTPR